MSFVWSVLFQGFRSCESCYERFTSRDAFRPTFSVLSLAAKLLMGSEKLATYKNDTGILYRRGHYDNTWTSHAVAEGGEKFVVFDRHVLNSRVCANGVAVKLFELRHDSVVILGLRNVYSRATLG